MKFPDWLQVYGDLKYRNKNCPAEQQEQVTFFGWLRAQHPKDYGVLALHVRNEGVRTWGQAAWHKAEGMATGASDIIIPGAPTFVCEMKRKDHTKSRWQDGQLEYLEAAQIAGAFVCVALGYEAAIEAFKTWNKP